MAYLLLGGALVRREGGFFQYDTRVDVAQGEGLGVRVQFVAFLGALGLDAVPEHHRGLVLGSGRILLGRLLILVLFGAAERAHVGEGVFFDEGGQVTRHGVQMRGRSLMVVAGR